MEALFLRIAAALGFSAVALGAFAAHGLKSRLSPEFLAIFEVGVRYQFYHALALLALSLAPAALWQSRLTPAAGWAWIVGVLIFSGSLYLLALTDTRWLGAITPIGGVAFLAGWLLLFLAAGQLSAR
ncbi:MAG: DUF423 domain-containing protein [Candidatus Hydrogenedens sp.]|nr:DUF423 domain-containing protein [Candidatus Hydrogenedens sp.]